MTGSGSGGPESKEEKRLNEDLVVFMRKRSDVDAYAPSLKTYVTLQQKRRRAAAARQKAEHAHDRTSDKKKQECDLKGKVKVPVSGEHPVGENEQRRRVISDKTGGVRSRSRSEDPSDACRRRRRRRRSCGRRRRRRSCRRRRRSCRRRRRSCRRRRRSCRRRRSRSRRRRRCGRCRVRRRRRRC